MKGVALETLVARSSSLKELDLSWNQLSAVTVQHIAQGAKESKTLEVSRKTQERERLRQSSKVVKSSLSVFHLRSMSSVTVAS